MLFLLQGDMKLPCPFAYDLLQPVPVVDEFRKVLRNNHQAGDPVANIAARRHGSQHDEAAPV